jgi:hypothetical protein
MSKKEKSAQSPLKVKTAAKSTQEGAIVVPPKTDKEQIFMAEEVDTLSSTKHGIKPGTKTKLKEFIGKVFADVEEKLNKFVSDGEVGSIRIVKNGQSFTGDYVSDRVQVFTGTDGEIKDLEIG